MGKTFYLLFAHEASRRLDIVIVGVGVPAAAAAPRVGRGSVGRGSVVSPRIVSGHFCALNFVGKKSGNFSLVAGAREYSRTFREFVFAYDKAN